MSVEIDGDAESTTPVWAAFGDLMSVLLGVFVLILVGVIGVQLQLSARLDAEARQRQAEAQRRKTLEQALSAPLAAGRVTLVDGAGRAYDGDEPYVVLLLDGRRQDAFKDFTPTAATAAMLERFLRQKDGSEVVISTIVDAVKLHSDLRHRREADRLVEQLGGLDPGSAEAQALKKKIDALWPTLGISR